jgi:nucleotide-binding universal stress UspA family protein
LRKLKARPLKQAMIVQPTGIRSRAEGDMSYAQILVVLSGAPDDARTARVAARLGKQHGAVVRALVAGPEPVPAVWGSLGDNIFYSQAVWDAIAAGEAERQRRAEEVVREAATEADLAHGEGEGGARMVLTKSGPTLWIGLRRELPLTDLVVAGQSCFRADGPFLGVLDSALMEGRAPLLIVRSDQALDGQPAAVAWDGSLEAGRAVRAAIPVLQHSQGVLVLQDPERLDDSERSHASPAALSRYLRLRGVGPVTARPISSEGPGVGLKQVATDSGAGLLVAGAFGHARVLEALFGGATRTLLDDDQGPHLFIAH